MEKIKIENLTFAYPNETVYALENVSISVAQGEFVTVCGKSGCGKSTLLRQIKPVLCPHGNKSGEVYFDGVVTSSMNLREQSQKIGFIMQSPENQIVTDKVWHELAFGLESLGISTPEIRERVAEMASFFGIQTWFHKKVCDLSGGQKQLLNLASVMVMRPEVLLLDEPTAQLDPIAAHNFLEMLSKINREIGTTIILTEHRLEEAFAISDRVTVMDSGKIIVCDTPAKVGAKLKEINHDMVFALPASMRIYNEVENGNESPVTVVEGRKWLERFAAQNTLYPECIAKSEKYERNDRPVIELKDIWFRYDKDLPDVLGGLSMKVHKGELYAIVGGNGTGKTTALSVMCGLNKAYRGEVLFDGVKANGINPSKIGLLPQNPQSLFVKKTVELDLYEMLSDSKASKSEKTEMIENVAEVCEFKNLLTRHPYDISGGEQQRVALAKILLLKPKILLMDEPTKGFDAHFKIKFADILNRLQNEGITIVMVSHDIEFCAEYADRCAMFFDGNIVSENEPRTFFSGKSFYTTAANRIAGNVLPNAVLCDDVIGACTGKKIQPKISNQTTDFEEKYDKPILPKQNKPRLSVKRILFGVLFLAMFTVVTAVFWNKFSDTRQYVVQFFEIVLLALGLGSFFSQKSLDSEYVNVQTPKEKRKLAKRTLTAMAMVLLAIPLTIYVGVYFLGERKYYFISLLILLETMLPFAMIFEGRKPQARELIIISVLCAIAVAGRAAFFMLPQFKPVVAVVIIAGVCFGGETGFLVGAVTGFVSNFFFGQGPYTPWQMFAFGIIGFIAGVLFRKGFLRKTKFSLCIFGGIATLVIYGGIMNPASVIMWQEKPNFAMFMASYAMGIPFDIVHAVATVFFLWFGAGPMIEKLDRIKVKYGIIE